MKMVGSGVGGISKKGRVFLVRKDEFSCIHLTEDEYWLGKMEECTFAVQMA